jgi:hypothetical protein
MMVKPAAVFGSETWAVAEMGMNRLGKEEREMLGRVYGPGVQ